MYYNEFGMHGNILHIVKIFYTKRYKTWKFDLVKIRTNPLSWAPIYTYVCNEIRSLRILPLLFSSQKRSSVPVNTKQLVPLCAYIGLHHSATCKMYICKISFSITARHCHLINM